MYSSVYRPAPLPENQSRVAGILRKLHEHRIRAGIGLGIIAILITGVTMSLSSSPKSSSSAPTVKKAQTGQSNRLRIIATGDTIAHDALNKQAVQPDGDYNYYQFMKPLQPYFDKADIRFCNQAVPGGGTRFGISGYPVFNSPLEVARDMNKLGCNVVNTGTNHTFDRGQPVIDAQLNYWDKLPNMLAVAGANRTPEEQAKLRTFTVKGVRFAFLSYTTYSNTTPPNSYGLTTFDSTKAQQDVTNAREKADVVLVSMRWGTEYSPAINSQQKQQAQLLADWGADIILGHGPHVLEPVEQLTGQNGRSALVWYSLGNFLNAQESVESLVSGLAVMDIDLKTKQVLEPAYLPIYMHYEWTPEEKARGDLLARHAFTMVPLDQAATLLARSQNNTTVEAQVTRITQLLNSNTSVKMLSSKTY